MDKKNLSVVRQMFAQTVFTHKVQECACERNSKKKNYFDWLTIIILSATLIILVLSLICEKSEILNYIGIALTIIEIVLLVMEKTFNFGGDAMQHKQSALKYLALRNEYLNLIADIIGSKKNDEEVIVFRDQLTKRYNEICDLSPQTEGSDYTCAQEKLGTKSKKGKGHLHWTEEEIDSFLPIELKLTQTP